MKKITCFFLVLLALVFIFPVLFLVVGSLMGKNELTDLLFPVLQEGAKGYASWKLFPEYPTLKHYVEVLLDSPEFFVMFWNSVKITAGALAGGLLVGMPAAWGFAKFDFPGKNILFTLYIALMMMPFQVMLLGNYLVGTDGDILLDACKEAGVLAFGDYFPGGFFYIPHIYYVPLFQRDSSGVSGSGKT